MFGDVGKIMKLAGEMKKKMPQIKERLANSTYTASAGGGAVEATVDGRMALVDIRVDKQVLAEAQNDPTMLEDLIKAAVAAAQTKASDAAAEAMKELTGGVELPGMGDFGL